MSGKVTFLHSGFDDRCIWMLSYSFQILYFKRKQLKSVLKISKSDRWQIWKSPQILFIALQNLFLFIFGALNQPKCDNMYPSHGKPVLYNTCRFWWTLKRNNGNNKWAIKTILIYFKPFICGLISMLGDMILACLPTLRLPALFLSVFAYKQGNCFYSITPYITASSLVGDCYALISIMFNCTN